MSDLKMFSNRSVLVTGHTGFKGSWLSAWLCHIGSQVTGVSLAPPSVPSHFDVVELSEVMKDRKLDICNPDRLKALVLETQPDFVFHLAAQSLVGRSFDDPLGTYQTNVQGTLNLLEALRLINKPCVAILITSDKCYENVEWIWGYRENDQLGGSDPYSASKSATEIMIRSHVKSFFPQEGPVRIGVARAGNVIGGGDWANDRIVPDCIRAWAKGDTALLRNPHSTRPWQHVLEPLSGYLSLALELYERPQLHGQPFNFGPNSQETYSVLELVKTKSKYWPGVSWKEAPQFSNTLRESQLLQLNCDKAERLLNWRATLSFEEAVRMTAEWYYFFYENQTAIREVTFAQIREYETLFLERRKHKGSEV